MKYYSKLDKKPAYILAFGPLLNLTHIHSWPSSQCSTITIRWIILNSNGAVQRNRQKRSEQVIEMPRIGTRRQWRSWKPWYVNKCPRFHISHLTQIPDGALLDSKGRQCFDNQQTMFLPSSSLEFRWASRNAHNIRGRGWVESWVMAVFEEPPKGCRQGYWCCEMVAGWFLSIHFAFNSFTIPLNNVNRITPMNTPPSRELPLTSSLSQPHLSLANDFSLLQNTSQQTIVHASALSTLNSFKSWSLHGRGMFKI